MRKLPPEVDQRIMQEAHKFVECLKVADYSPKGLVVASYIAARESEYWFKEEELQQVVRDTKFLMKGMEIGVDLLRADRSRLEAEVKLLVRLLSESFELMKGIYFDGTFLGDKIREILSKYQSKEDNGRDPQP